MWILIFVIFILFNLIAFFVPRRLSKIEIYATSIFAFVYGLSTDIILNLHYHLYGYFQEGFDWLGLLGIILYFPSISFLFLNFYPSNRKIWNKILYILLWSAFSTFFEWVSLQTEFFYYTSWKLWYSALLYPFIFLILIIHWKFIQKLNHK
ncbi:CBO0543 family protein [Gracilibacillus salitolerans]|uniref:CBO0543 family protein n=1 Tax=Gracilibacillus salitolerans TaxID=2663022 RepID=UPI003898D694